MYIKNLLIISAQNPVSVIRRHNRLNSAFSLQPLKNTTFCGCSKKGTQFVAFSGHLVK